ncbi:MAG: iron-containing alcohol dehydrogenase [Myxococcales bacterium]|nr:iron-containing alcohol dehydrogenase [Myxococcales bacterium]
MQLVPAGPPTRRPREQAAAGLERSVVLVGLPGSGKTAVGRLLAVRLGVPHVDLDEAIAHSQGASPADLLRREGEAAFRIREAETLGDVLSGPPAVVSSGGGTPCFHGGMERMRAGAWVVWLAVTPRVAAERTLLGGDRPLLGQTRPEHLAALASLHGARNPVYCRAHARVDADRGPDEVVAGVVRALRPVAERSVDVGNATTRIAVHAGHAWDGADRLADLAGGAGVLLVVDSKVAAEGEGLADALRARGLATAVVELAGGERSKDLRTAQRIWEALAAAGLGGGDLLIAVGGGAVCDVAAFAASAWHRGMRLALVPTTVLAMADASLGGKTAINLAGNKNPVGTFYPAARVECGLACLATAAARDFRAGLAEIAKIFLAFDSDAWQSLLRDASRLRRRDTDILLPHLVRAQELKAMVVAADPDETADAHAPLTRLLLNFGHTLGHAIEAESAFQLRHGEAVSLGLVAAAEFSEAQAWAAPGSGAEVRTGLAALGLPVDWEAWATPRALARLGADKKRAADTVRFVAMARAGQARVEVCRIDWLRGILQVLAAARPPPSAARRQP